MHELRLVRIRHHHLEIGPAAIDLERHQGRMVECRLVDAPQVGGGALLGTDRHGALPIVRGGEREVAIDVARLDHREHRVASAVEILAQPLVIRRKPALDRAQQETSRSLANAAFPNAITSP